MKLKGWQCLGSLVSQKDTPEKVSYSTEEIQISSG